jgi:hypothetical protein
MVSSCSRAVLWSTCPTVGVGNPASILESVRPPKSAEAHVTGTGSGSTGRFLLESGPSLSLRGESSLLESSCARACPLSLEPDCPLCVESSLSLVVLLEPVPWGVGPRLSLGFVLNRQRRTAPGLGQLLGFPGNLDRARPLCLCGIEPVPWRFGPSLSLGFVIPKEFPNPTLTGSSEVP